MAVSDNTQTLPAPQSAIERRRFLTTAGGLAAATAVTGAVAVLPVLPVLPSTSFDAAAYLDLVLSYGERPFVGFRDGRRVVTTGWYPDWEAVGWGRGDLHFRLYQDELIRRAFVREAGRYDMHPAVLNSIARRAAS